MTVGPAGYPGGALWSIDAVPYHALARELVYEDALLFYILASASFVEITSDIYTRNLVEFFRDDQEIVEWLELNWEKEELQHGAALRRYVQTAWPEFDWDGAYRSFLAEFTRFCSVDQLAETRALEMAARCVVETGTAAFYRALSELSPEPVWRQITSETDWKLRDRAGAPGRTWNPSLPDHSIRSSVHPFPVPRLPSPQFQNCVKDRLPNLVAVVITLRLEIISRLRGHQRCIISAMALH